MTEDKYKLTAKKLQELIDKELDELGFDELPMLGVQDTHEDIHRDGDGDGDKK